MRPLALALGALIFSATGCHRCVVRQNERADLFPTPARLNPETRTWSVIPEGRIYKPEQPAAVKSAVAGVRLANLVFGNLDTPMIEQRLSSLFGKNQSNRPVQVNFAGSKKPVKVAKTNAQGRFEKEIEIPEKNLGKPDADGFAQYNVSSCENGVTVGTVQLLEPHGLSVVSTVDDTIKVTGVDDPAGAAANALFGAYKPVDGMAPLFQSWRNKGAAFHYISSMPAELYPSFAHFLGESGFPKGSIHMRPWTGMSGDVLARLEQVAELFHDTSYKTGMLTQLVERFPTREFVLVGNSALNDPEVFGQVARQYPERIRAIYILESGSSTEKNADRRFDDAFRGLSPKKWRIVRHPRELFTAL